MLRGSIPPTLSANAAITGSLLMRIFAVAKWLSEFERQVQRGGQRRFVEGRSGEPRGDVGVVSGDASERYSGQRATRCCREFTLLTQFGEHAVVLRRVHHHTDMGMILCGRTNERWPTYVDEVNARIAAEGIQVYHRESERFDAICGKFGDMLGLIEVGQQSAVNHRMQRDYAVPQNGGISGEVGKVYDRQTCASNGFGGSTAADEAPTKVVQSLRKLNDSGLIEH